MESFLGVYKGRIRALQAAKRAAAAIEYGIIAALVSLAGVAAMPGMAQSLSSTFDSVSDALGGYFNDGAGHLDPNSPSAGPEAAGASAVEGEQGKKSKKIKKPKKD